MKEETERRTDVVEVFPDAAPPLRPAGSVLIDLHGVGGSGRQHYFSEASMLEVAVMNNPIEVCNEAEIRHELVAA